MLGRGVSFPFLMLLLGALFAPVQAGSEAEKSVLGPRDIRQNLFAACFLNEHQGWIVGELGRVFYTNDGGQSFVRGDTKTKTAIVGVACFPDQSLVVAGPKGTVMLSGDAGKTWSAGNTGTERNLLSIAFADRKVGMAVGDYGTMIRTEDGGKTWSPIAIPGDIPLAEEIAETINPADVLLYDVDFADATHGWIVGEFGVMFSTDDAGLTWTARKSPVDTTLFGVEFVDPMNGWAVGLESVMLRTTDGGESWEKLPVPTETGFVLSVYDIAVSGQIGWAVGDSGLLLRSVDGGKTWSRVELPIELAGNWFRGVSISPSAHGFIVGSDGLMLRVARDQFHQLRKS